VARMGMAALRGKTDHLEIASTATTSIDLSNSTLTGKDHHAG